MIEISFYSIIHLFALFFLSSHDPHFKNKTLLWRITPFSHGVKGEFNECNRWQRRALPFVYAAVYQSFIVTACGFIIETSLD